MTKREHWILGIVALVVLLYFGWPYIRSGYAWAMSIFNAQRSYVVNGTADSGADATVLTSACQ